MTAVGRPTCMGTGGATGRTLTALLILGGVAACGEGGAASSAEPEPRYRCGPVALPWPDGDPADHLDEYTGALAGVEEPTAASTFDPEPPLTSTPTWWVAEQGEAGLLLLGPRQERGADAYVFAEISGTGDDRVLADWDFCALRGAAEGYSAASARIKDEPDRDATVLNLVGNEYSCASGISPDEEDVRPVVAESADAVDVLVLIESSGGDASCPANPDFPVQVVLDAPLGDRELRDASVWPPVVLPVPGGVEDI